MIVTLDFETYYSSDYSLTKMSEVEYILSPLFETLMCAVKEGDAPAETFVGDAAVRARLAAIDWSRAALLSHNTRFDGAIAAWHYGVQPAMYLDTMSMARPLVHPVTGSSSLAKLAEYFGLASKGTEVVLARGKRLADFALHDLIAYRDYCAHDAELCRELFGIFMRVFPRSELAVIDSLLRMYIEPKVALNAAKLCTHLAEVQAEKAAALARVAHIDKKVFSSNKQFAELLESLGVEVPTKLSPTTNQEVPALARNDRAFKDLCKDDSQPIAVQAVLAARLSTKSTIEETRTQTMLKLALREWGGGQTGLMPVPYRYYGAHTGRPSGSGGFNFANLRRDSGIRDAIEAPPGWRVMHRDSSQIEARMVAMLANCLALLEAFEKGRDVYSEFASDVYGYLVDKAKKLERFVGKTCLAAGTRVLTDRGWVAIEEIRQSHLLWDGVEWVGHDGLMGYGLKETMPLCGLQLTPDHLVWCGIEWKEAQYLALDESGRFLRLALEAASLPSPAMSSVSEAESSPYSCDATVARPNTQSTDKTSKSFAARAAMRALRRLLVRRGIGSILQKCRLANIGLDCSTDFLLRSPDVTPVVAKSINTMAGEVLRCARSGATIGQRFFAMSKRFLGGMTHLWKWTGLTTTGGTNRGTSGSQVGRSTSATNVESKTSNKKSESLRNVYDLLNAGPRSRFTVMTDAGPMIVSNSILGLGYGMGPERFKVTLYLGNGGISVDLSVEEAAKIVWKYRDKYYQIPQLWSALSDWLMQMLCWNNPAGGGKRRKMFDVIPAVPCVEFGHNSIWLPNGLCISYPNLRHEITLLPNGERRNEIVYDDPYGDPKRLFGGKAVENISQALARIVITDVMVRVKAETGFDPFMTTYDSLDYCVPAEDAPWWDAYLERQFAMRPSWAPGLPLASEGGWGRTLKEAEKAVNN